MERDPVMKSIKALIVFLSVLLPAVLSAGDMDSVIRLIMAEKDDNLRIELIYALYAATSENDPQISIEREQQVLQAAQQHNDCIAEAMALAATGASYRLMGNTAKGLAYHLKALSIAEHTGNLKLMAYIKVNMGNIYRDRLDFERAVSLYRSSERDAVLSGSYKIESWNLGNLGIIYLELHKLDSALMYSQRAYEICKRYAYDQFLSDILSQLGGIHGKLGNAELAVGYYQSAIAEAGKTKNPRYLNWAYYGLADYYTDAGEADSGALYARKAINSVEHTAFLNLAREPAKMLAAYYSNNNCDSTLKYAELYRVSNDSLYNIKAVQQIQLLTFEEQMRQQELAQQKLLSEEQRKQNIQYALIAIVLVTMLVLYLLFGHRVITSTRWIQFFGVFALLNVFEFLNLLMNPLLEWLTNDRPVYMFLALVAIAALLVPLHNRIEAWAVKVLLEKNERLRLKKAG